MPERDSETITPIAMMAMLAHATFLTQEYRWSTKPKQKGRLKAKAEATPAGLSKLPQTGNAPNEVQTPVFARWHKRLAKLHTA